MHGVLQKSVKLKKSKYIASLCPYGCGDYPWPTRYNVSRGRSTLPVPLNSFLPPDKPSYKNSYIRNHSIGFDNSHYMRSLQGCISISTLTQGWSWSQTVRIPYMIGVYIEWNTQKHPNMYYVLNTHHCCSNSDMIIHILPSTETSHLWPLLLTWFNFNPSMDK